MQAIATPMTQAMKEWTKIFPKNMTENYTSSVTFMKQLTVVAISTITYLKNFPDDSYTLEQFAGLKLRILKKKCRDEFADFISTALTQAFEAFDKKYLHQLALCFYKDEFTTENLLEYYIFEYSYNKDGVSMSVHSKTRDSERKTSKFTFDNVRDRTVQLIRACMVIMQTTQHNSIEFCDVSLRLYYNEDAPPGYNVSGFTAAGPSEDHIGETIEQAIKLGSVETPYHRVMASSFVRDSLLASHEAIPSQNAPMMTQNDDDDFEEEANAWSESRVRCPCNKRDENVLMLTCFYCNTRQHAECFGVRSPRAAAHCCERCAGAGRQRSPTDGQLAELPPRKRECLCIFRRALMYLTRVSEVTAESVASHLGITSLNMAKLMKLLYFHGILLDGRDSEAPKKVLTEKLNAVISKYFQTSENNIVDRLLAETFASQESTPDPIGDVLEPLEKVSLQNTDTLGRVIDNVARSPVVEDSTLLQYREAVLSNYQRDEELPLSGSHNPVKDMENLGKKLGKRKTDDGDRPNLRSASLKTKRAKLRA
ncbi:uncharacterized protein LOC106132165 [Amyelois transitella]|uniref:uncharacterized protein LOC106132165 n=1 Tax=Amyelois transitella TaxID=680683 RepID=UPI002990579F|nr:uncharacterized protein LOC106132165 [Amyelois transitella]